MLWQVQETNNTYFPRSVESKSALWINLELLNKNNSYELYLVLLGSSLLFAQWVPVELWQEATSYSAPPKKEIIDLLIHKTNVFSVNYSQLNS